MKRGVLTVKKNERSQILCTKLILINRRIEDYIMKAGAYNKFVFMICPRRKYIIYCNEIGNMNKTITFSYDRRINENINNF